MKALTYHGRHDVRVDDVADPAIQDPTDAIIRVTSAAVCGSDLHLYDVLGPFIEPGSILGHEAMGVVEETGTGVTQVRRGDRVVIPFNIACGSCFMCTQGLYAQCETTQVREEDKGAAIYGYTKLYGSVPGGQAEYLRVPQAHFGPIKVSDEGPDERYLFLSDVLPTAWQAVKFADIPQGGSVTVVGLGPIGQMAARIARHHGAKAIGVDLVPARLEMARRHGIQTIDESTEDVVESVRDLTEGRGTDSVIDAVGMEAHGSMAASAAQKVTNMLPDRIAAPLMQRAGVDRMAALRMAFDIVRRGGTISIVGVYGGMSDPFPMMQLFDKGITIRMGQAHVKRWVDDLLPLVNDESDPLGLGDFVTHTMPLEQAPRAYEMFQKKRNGAVKVVLTP